ncbi:MAG: hypothetical protein ACNA8W_02595, partial [Bradymonadaceae bacterium]
LNSTSELYDPASNAPLEIHVRVRDDDSNQVTLTMPRAMAPEGASFESTGTHEGQFTWMPSPAQITRRVHTAMFIADDGDNAPVEHRVTIIIQQKDTTGPVSPGQEDSCAAEELIDHTPLGAQRTAAGYPLEVSLKGPSAGRYDEVYGYWTLDDPLNGSGQRWEAVEMALDGSIYKGAIPNLLLPAGESKPVYYQLCAYDFDGADDDEAAIVCGPSSVVYSFIAYSPDHDGCIDDPQRSNDRLLASHISREAWTHHRLCKDEPDFHSIKVEPGESVTLVVLFPFGQTANFALIDEHEANQDLFVSSCAGFALADVEVDEGGSPKTYYIQAGGHDVAYQITAYSSGTGGNGTCPGQHLEPNNTPSQATLIVDDSATFENIGICSAEDLDIYAMELVRGDILSASLYFTHAQGDLEMVLYAPSQQADVTQMGTGVALGLSTTDDESIDYTAVESGFYFLSVFTADNPNVYDLEIDAPCRDADPYAGNHTQAQAALVSLDSHENLKLCPGQADWFRRQGFAGTDLVVEVDVEYGGQASDVTLELYNESGQRVAAGSVFGDFVDLEYAPTQNAPYFIKVQTNRKMLYTLTVLQFDS